jgi:acetyltransferase-like isoleucine patch superfamily enzyme
MAKVDQSFLDLIQNDEQFKELSGDLKIELYRKYGAEIGADVKIGKGSILLCKDITIQDSAEIGNNCIIKCNSFSLGKMSVIGNNANIITRHVNIGDVFYSGNNILIGGGGAYDRADSGLTVGDSCLISSGCIINTCYPVMLGNNVGLSPNVSIYTHSHWCDVLKGYKSSFGKVTIGDDAYITGNVMIVPGITIGKGAVVLANSTVIKSVPDYTIVCGVPAKEFQKIDPDLSFEKKHRIFTRIWNELKEHLREKGYYNDLEYIVESEKILLKNRFVTFDITNYEITSVEAEYDDFTNEVRNFLRKRGIKFKPIYWRYENDKGFFNQ